MKMIKKNLIIFFTIFALAVFALLYIMVSAKKILKEDETNIPAKSSLFKNAATLSPDYAFMFKSDDDYLAYSYITSVIRQDEAEYVFVILKKNEDGRYQIKESKKGAFTMGKSQFIRSGKVAIFWQFPTTLYAVEGVKGITIVPISKLHLIKEGNIDELNLKWTSVTNSNL